MVTNFLGYPYLEEAQRANKMRELCEKDFGKLRVDWQAELDAELAVFNIDKVAGNALLQEYYTQKIEGVNSQESYDKVFDEYYRIIYLTAKVKKSAEVYRYKLENALDDITRQKVCPCCGRTIPHDFIAEQFKEIDGITRQINFYKSFFDARRQEIGMLQKKAEKKGYNVHALAFLNVLFSLSDAGK